MTRHKSIAVCVMVFACLQWLVHVCNGLLHDCFRLLSFDIIYQAVLEVCMARSAQCLTIPDLVVSTCMLLAEFLVGPPRTRLPMDVG